MVILVVTVVCANLSNADMNIHNSHYVILRHCILPIVHEYSRINRRRQEVFDGIESPDNMGDWQALRKVSS